LRFIIDVVEVAFEIKLGIGAVDIAADNLLKIAAKI